MSFPSWIRKPGPVPQLSQASHASRAPYQRAAARYRPRLEALEDRLVLSTINVTTTADGVAGSLRAAIIEANASKGHDTIIVPAGTYTLTLAGANEDDAATGDLDIRNGMTISGAGADTTVIDGGGLDRVFQIFGAEGFLLRPEHCGRRGQPGWRPFQWRRQCDPFAVRNQRGSPGAAGRRRGRWRHLQRGWHSEHFRWLHWGGAFGGDGSSGGSAVGGSIYVDTGSTLVVSNAVIRGYALGGAGSAGGTGGSAEGGGIYAAIGTSVTLTNSSIGLSTATGNGGYFNGVRGGVGAGGAIYDAGADLTVDHCNFYGNEAIGGTAYLALAGNGMGGAIFVAGGNASVANSFFEGNYTFGGGGPAGGDSLGGAYLAAGNVALNNSTIQDSEVNGGGGFIGGTDEGGGIFQAAGTLTVSHCSLSGNEATGGLALGGGIYVGGGTLTLTNSTLSGNFVQGTTGIGGGLYIAGGSVCMDRTTFLAIAGNFASTSNPDISRPVHHLLVPSFHPS